MNTIKCTFCGRTNFKSQRGLDRHNMYCPPMEYRRLESETNHLKEKAKEQAEEIKRLREKLENKTTNQYINCTFNVVTTGDAIKTIHDTLHHFLQEATPFIKRHAKDEDLQLKLIAWGKENADPAIQKVVTNVIENKLPFDKTNLVEGNLENPQEVEQGYLKEKQNLVKKLNEIVDVENLPEYDEDEEFLKQVDNIVECDDEKFLKEIDKLLETC